MPEPHKISCSEFFMKYNIYIAKHQIVYNSFECSYLGFLFGGVSPDGLGKGRFSPVCTVGDTKQLVSSGGPNIPVLGSAALPRVSMISSAIKQHTIHN